MIVFMIKSICPKCVKILLERKGDFMEKNEINNQQVKEMLGDYAVNLLLSQNLIQSMDLPYIKISFGYIFSKDDGALSALFRLIVNEQTYFFSLQNGSLSIININMAIYEDTITTMKTLHNRLNDEVTDVETTTDTVPKEGGNLKNETELQLIRKQKNNNFLLKHNISFAKSLSCLYKDEEISLKSLDEVCKRAIVCLIIVQIACDIRNGRYEESKEFFLPLLKNFDVENCLNSKEKRIIDGSYTDQDVIDMDWAYEAYWALCWCLGLINDISNSSMLCDCNLAVAFVVNASSFDEFKNKCKLRSIQEILDMHDLYYRYNWVVNEKKVNPRACIGNINPSIAIERRRALEWLLSDIDDWYNIRLNA